MNADQATPASYSILVGVDYSETSTLALVEAIAVARQHAQCQLHFVRVVPEPTPNEELQHVATELQMYVARILGTPGDEGAADHGLGHVTWTTHVRLSEPVHAITQLACDLEVHLVVVGTHGRQGLHRFLLGSVAEGVVRYAPCPVLVVRPIGAKPEGDVPKIEPACPQCVAARRATQGKELSCEQHKTHQQRRHTYHFSPLRSSQQSGLLYPLR
jgi:nucleotide-binding universal stress UspA family protein